jgi:hypothetical protein
MSKFKIHRYNYINLALRYVDLKFWTNCIQHLDKFIMFLFWQTTLVSSCTEFTRLIVYQPLTYFLC